MDYYISFLLNFILNYSALVFLSSMEAVFIMHKYKPIFHVLLLISTLLLFIINFYLSKPQPVYLVDFSCLKPPHFCRVPLSTYLEHIRSFHFLNKKSVEFMSKFLISSGQGEETYFPPSLFYIPPLSSHYEATKEVHMVLFPVFEDLLSKTNLSPPDIDILIVNCSGFCPSPSLSSIIVNKYSMRDDIKSFSLSGMGCSAGAVAIDMAKNLLKIQKNSNAVILSTEILSTGWYQGNEQPKLILNCIFRMGSAAILVTNKKEAKNKSKYKLHYSLRTQRAFDDKAYHSAIREEDSNGITGVTVTKDSVQAAGETVLSHIISLGSSILPFVEKSRYVISVVWKNIVMDYKRGEIYVPNFGSVIQHFCLPTSGNAMLRRIGKELKLGEREMEGSLMTFHRFGNQSSSSMWYVLAYMEAKGRVKKGDKVWQLGLGSGFKCCSLVWECIGPVVGEPETGPWADCINRYPVSSSNN